MSLFGEQIKSVLQDVHRFLTGTLPGEHLTVKADDERLTILQKIVGLRERFPQLEPDGSDEEGPPEVSSPPGRPPDHSDNIEESDYGEVGPSVPADSLKDAVISSYLMKQRKQDRVLSKLKGKRQRRWCAVRGVTFYYYMKDSDKKQRNCFSLVGYDVRALEDSSAPNLYPLELHSPTKRTYQFYAFSESDRKSWLEVLTNLIRMAGAQQGAASYLNGPTIHQNNNIQLGTGDEYDEVNTQRKLTAVMPRTGNDEENRDSFRESQIYDEIDKQVTPTLSMGVKPPTRVEETSPQSRPLPQQPQKQQQSPPTPQQQRPRQEQPNQQTGDGAHVDLYHARWRYTSSRPDELSFESGDIISIVDKRFGSVNWWVGRRNGKEGLAPSTYLVPLFIS